MLGPIFERWGLNPREQRVASIALYVLGTFLVLAVPVAPAGWVRGLRDVADELIALITPRELRAIGLWYSDFSQSSDEEVVACLKG